MPAILKLNDAEQMALVELLSRTIVHESLPTVAPGQGAAGHTRQAGTAGAAIAATPSAQASGRAQPFADTEEAAAMSSGARRRGHPKVVDTPHPVDIHVGSRIRLRRRELRVSQSELAAELGVSYQQVQKFERAVNRISASQLYHVSNALGVEVPFFYEGYEPAEAFEPDPLVHPDTIRLIDAFFAINDPELRRHLLDLARTLAGERTRRRGRPSRCPC